MALTTMLRRLLFACSLALLACVSIQAAPAETSSPEWKEGWATSPDGTRVPLFYATPTGAGSFPVIIYLHGAPGGVGQDGLRHLLDSSRWTRCLAEGFAVVVADYRGHAPDKPFDVLLGDVNATDDLAAIVKQLGSDSRLDVHRLVIWGQSLGGLITLDAASRGKITASGLIVSAPAIFPFIGYHGPRGGSNDRELGDDEIDRSGALARIEKITTPVLILQGTGDGLCPLNKKLFSLLQTAHKNARLELFPGAPHGFVNGPENDAYRHALDLIATFARERTAPPTAKR